MKISERLKRKRAVKLAEIHNKANKILQTHYVVYEPCTCPEGSIMFNRQGKQVQIDPRVAKAITQLAFPWTINCCVLIREKKKGKKKLELMPIDASTCKHSEISQQIGKAHVEWAETYPQDIVVTLGWIATYQGNDLSAEVAMEIFEQLGCWDNLAAKWELKTSE